MPAFFARALVPSAAVAGALLAFVPGGAEPFSGPKRAVLGAAAAAALALLPWSRARLTWPLGLLLASAAASATLGPFTAPVALKGRHTAP